MNLNHTFMESEGHRDTLWDTHYHSDPSKLMVGGVVVYVKMGLLTFIIDLKHISIDSGGLKSKIDLSF